MPCFAVQQRCLHAKLHNLPLSPCICHTGAAEPLHPACSLCTTCCKCDFIILRCFLLNAFAFRAILSSGSLITGITTNTQTLPWTPTPPMTGTSGLTLAGCGTMRYAHSQSCHSHTSPFTVLCAWLSHLHCCLFHCLVLLDSSIALIRDAPLQLVQLLW